MSLKGTYDDVKTALSTLKRGYLTQTGRQALQQQQQQQSSDGPVFTASAAEAEGTGWQLCCVALTGQQRKFLNTRVATSKTSSP